MSRYRNALHCVHYVISTSRQCSNAICTSYSRTLSVYTYADDIVMVANDANICQAAIALQTCFNRHETWLDNCKHWTVS